MSHTSIRDLQKISGETIGALSGPTAVKSGNRTVGLLVPVKAADPDRLAALAGADIGRGQPFDVALHGHVIPQSDFHSYSLAMSASAE